MANTRFYLDARRVQSGKPSMLRIAIAQKGVTALIPLNVKLTPEQWDGKKIVRHSDAAVLNAYISDMMRKVNSVIADITRNGAILTMTAAQVKNYVLEEITPEKKAEKERETTFLYRFEKYAERLSPGSQRTYKHTISRLIAFIGEASLKTLRFEDINRDWLNSFNTFMAQTAPSQNARNIHFRNMRAVFNDAIDNGITTNYPFRKFKLKNVATEKRSLSVEELRRLFFFKCEQHAEKYVDMFKLSFFLRGVNMKDISLLPATALKNGRLGFNRAKTGHLYSMLVEPEAEQIIEKHKGTNHLVFILDHWDSDEFFRRKMNKEIQKVGPMRKAPGRGGKKVYEPLFPELTSYWARHSWATIAAELDIPNEVIAEGLGHEYGNPITNIYIRFDNKKVDVANRKVIDWVLYGKIDGEVVVEPGTPEFFGLDRKRTAQLGLLIENPAEPQEKKKRGRPRKRA